ncbi:aspartyl-phosphate phosphatase Spo0E family protein [Bacillus weihaiensis]|uniref:aspartyl-phosphate phosphatase Spo0E family protein n=1 Tax=Bacillus weihaiensis TaxID=1547283 RepID=UPI002352820E|nr:aspartyl-phosphate phosphatase Spo0E family protein [Bacillus weihaiensis]
MKVRDADLVTLEIEINNLRTNMMVMAKKKGLIHPETVNRSQKLDRLLNKYDKVKSLK